MSLSYGVFSESGALRVSNLYPCAPVPMAKNSTTSLASLALIKAKREIERRNEQNQNQEETKVKEII